ncbi:hypothetical protein [Bradyrhizobium sp. WSM3983]|uniref:hypothetical protein n=1 Tax=Bradyrhizobium sp. WSM3983 TaxID=1038867 RepID=UPI0003F8F812|nr:hypothetical protein [Bradyrhizobium sp. WSM3983]
MDHLSFTDYSGDIINASHRHLAAAPLGHQGVDFLIELGITGYLRRGDALKLYERRSELPEIFWRLAPTKDCQPRF